MDDSTDAEQNVSILVTLLLLEAVREENPGDNDAQINELLEQLRSAMGDHDPARLIARTSAAVMRLVFRQNGGNAEEILQSFIIHGSGAE